MTIALPKLHICLTRTGQESFLQREIALLPNQPQCTEVAPGVIGLSGIPLSFFETTPLFFSCQLLPDATPLDGTSIKTLATSVVTHLVEKLDSETSPWALHIFDAATATTGKPRSRARLVREECLTILKQKRRALLKRLEPSLNGDTVLVQVLLGERLDDEASPARSFISFTSADLRVRLGPSISPALAGYEEIPDDKAPPSRAFKKLVEALSVFNLVPRRGERCVDLGACPGGWTHVMIQRGLKVIAVDRSPLAPHLMKDRNVSFVKGDAFSWLPEAPVEWLICDVITSPDRTFKILDTWLTKKLCSQFCVTVKFKGEPDFQTLYNIRLLLKEKTKWFAGKQLANNKNELTVVGKL